MWEGTAAFTVSVSSAVQPLKTSRFSFLSELPKVAVFRAAQFWKAWLSTSVTLSGNVIFVRPVLEKALEAIVFMPSGSCTEASDEQPEKALMPMLSTLEGITTACRFLQFLMRSAR